MFGLHNFSGSCWVNACLQGIFRIPEIKDKLIKNETVNSVDGSLSKIWNSQGKEGLKEFFLTVRTDTMPAGRGIGDSNELLIYLCDKIPYFDELCRFKVAEQIKCTCGFSQIKEDSVIEFELFPPTRQCPMSECITKVVSPEKLDDWKCDKCSEKGNAIKQKLIGTFPKVMLFRITNQRTSIQYPSVLVMNVKKYYLMSVICHTGGHWFTYSREMPPGTSWYTFDDRRVRQHSPSEFPISELAKVLIYYQIDE
jgi:ubiquitin C-terminal hydrolase